MQQHGIAGVDGRTLGTTSMRLLKLLDPLLKTKMHGIVYFLHFFLSFLGAESEDNLNKLLSLSENKTAGTNIREPSPVILLKYNNPSSPKNESKKSSNNGLIKPSQSQNSLSSNPNVSLLSKSYKTPK